MWTQPAVQEICIRSKDSDSRDALMAHYYDIQRGIGAHKSVLEQGAFPTDPYSHTPAMMGAQQPGLTGQVKEDVIARLWELGVRIHNGCIGFDPFLSTESGITFTICSVPVEMQRGEAESIAVVHANGEKTEYDGSELNTELSAEIFNRTGSIARIIVTVPAGILLEQPAPAKGHDVHISV